MWTRCRLNNISMYPPCSGRTLWNPLISSGLKIWWITELRDPKNFYSGFLSRISFTRSKLSNLTFGVQIAKMNDITIYLFRYFVQVLCKSQIGSFKIGEEGSHLEPESGRNQKFDRILDLGDPTKSVFDVSFNFSPFERAEYRFEDPNLIWTKIPTKFSKSAIQRSLFQYLAQFLNSS